MRGQVRTECAVIEWKVQLLPLGLALFFMTIGSFTAGLHPIRNLPFQLHFSVMHVEKYLGPMLTSRGAGQP